MVNTTINKLAKAAQKRTFARRLQISFNDGCWSVTAIPEPHIAQAMVRCRYPLSVLMHLTELSKFQEKELAAHGNGNTLEEALEQLQPNADVLAAVEELNALTVQR